MKKKFLIGMMVMGAVALTGCAAQKNTEQSKTEDQAQEQQENEISDEEKEEQAAEDVSKSEEANSENGSKKEEADAENGSKNETSEKSAANGVFGKFETVTHYGTAVTQDIFTEADLTMVNIWGTFCSPCIREMPDLGELADEYAEKGVQIVGIVSDVTAAWNTDVELIIQETGADYTHLMVSQSLWNGYLSNVQVVPTTVFVDSEGKQVGEVYTGSREKAAWAAIIEEMLGLLEE